MVFSSLLPRLSAAPSPSVPMQFGGSRFERVNHVLKIRGNAWIRYGLKEVHADELDWDPTTKEALASGNVHISDGPYDVWCNHAEYSLSEEKGVLEEGTVAVGQLVFSGAVVRKLNRTDFEIEDGSYTNCNVDLVKDKNVGSCQFDWKIYGRHFSITLEKYAHVQDAMLYVSRLPVLYTPYVVVPVKTHRESGLLMPQYVYTSNLGSGVTWPYFQVLGPWHDATLTPTWYAKTGYHLGVEYRYLYSQDKYGTFDFYLTQRRFNADFFHIEDENTGRPRALGFIGEGAISVRNIYSFGERGVSRQIIHLVSNPYYPNDYGADVSTESALSWLRSQLSVTYPTDDFLFTGRVMYHQPLIISRDTGVDRGAVMEIPTLTASKTTSSLWGKLLSYEVDTQFNNFYRPWVFDNVPDHPIEPLPSMGALNLGTHSAFGGNDYLRVGRRFQFEPHLIANIPMPSGLQLQPSLTAGSLVYQFDTPTTQVLHREYLQAEVPLSIYLHRNFDTSISGFERISHVFQPRLIYGSSVFQSDDPDHPFFYRNRRADLILPAGTPVTASPYVLLSNPRFDIWDQMPAYHYGRVELINRFRRKSGSSIERFLLLQVADQYNFRLSDEDARYSRQWGPLELFGQFNIWRFSAQIEANYQWELSQLGTNPPVHEGFWSSSLTYASPDKDLVTVSTRFYNNADPTLTEQTLVLNVYKTLPIFFDLEGNMEYSMRQGQLLGYSIGFLFASKPRSCWGLEFATGQNAFHVTTATVNFKFDFGNPRGAKPL